MALGRDIEVGVSTYGKAIGFIFRHNLWWYFIFPIILNLIIWFSGIAVTESIKESAELWLLDTMGSDNPNSFWGGFLNTALSWFVGITFAVILFVIFAYFGGYVVLVLLSPVMAFLSEKTEKIITGNDYPFNGDQLMRDIVRGVLVAARNFCIELGWIIVLFVISFIPVIGWLTTIILFFISAYFFGFSFMDYTNERRCLSISESVKFIRKHKGLAIANGSVFTVLLLIPLCGVTLAGFAAIIAVVAATLAVHEVVGLDNRSEGQVAQSPKTGNLQ